MKKLLEREMPFLPKLNINMNSQRQETGIQELKKLTWSEKACISSQLLEAGKKLLEREVPLLPKLNVNVNSQRQETRIQLPVWSKTHWIGLSNFADGEEVIGAGDAVPAQAEHERGGRPGRGACAHCRAHRDRNWRTPPYCFRQGHVVPRDCPGQMFRNLWVFIGPRLSSGRYGVSYVSWLWTPPPPLCRPGTHSSGSHCSHLHCESTCGDQVWSCDGVTFALTEACLFANVRSVKEKPELLFPPVSPPQWNVNPWRRIPQASSRERLCVWIATNQAFGLFSWGLWYNKHFRKS